MSRMPCRISDGPDYDTWLERQNRAEPDEDAAYRRMIQEEVDQHRQDELEEHRRVAKDADLAQPAPPQLHTKIGKFTGAPLYSYDQAYWFSTPEVALRAFQQINNTAKGTNDV